jgi:hypothetical protein
MTLDFALEYAVAFLISGVACSLVAAPIITIFLILWSRP